MLRQLKTDRVAQLMLVAVVLVGCAACGIWGVSLITIAKRGSTSTPPAQAQQKTATPTVTPTPTRLRLPTVTRAPTGTPTPEPRLLDTFEGAGFDTFTIEIPGPGKFKLEVVSDYKVDMALYGPIGRITPCVNAATELRALFVTRGEEIENELPDYYKYPSHYCVVVAPDGITEMDYAVYSSIPWTVRLTGNIDY